jgi:hypothetical protein
MASNIKYSFATLRKRDGTISHRKVYATSDTISARFQLAYFYRQGYTGQDKKILDVLNSGEGPLDKSLEELKSSKKPKFRTELENMFSEKFIFHSKEILIEEDSIDTSMIKDSKETQKLLDDFMQKNPKGSYTHYISGLYHEKAIKGVESIEEAIESYQKGHLHNFCQFSTVKLLRMNLETMELNQSTLATNFEKAFDICGYIFSNAGVFFYIENDTHLSPLFYYISVMMDIYREFREFIFGK